ncbi:MAG: chemotaxis protein CheA [Pseudomonadota bacterium]
MDPMAEIKQTFFLECEDLLVETETGLMDIESGDGDDETVNAVFRAVHSIKGGAGAFGLDTLVKFAHTFETTLDEVRAGRLDATPDVMKVFLRAADVLADLVRAARDDAEPDEERSQAIIADLAGLAGADPNATAEEEDDDIDFEPAGLDMDLDLDLPDIDPTTTYEIAFKPEAALYANGNEALLLLRALSEAGDIETTCGVEAVPTLDALDPEGAYFSWAIRLKTEQSRADVSDVFEFVDGDCALTIRDTDMPETDDAPSLDDDPAVPDTDATDAIDTSAPIDAAPIAAPSAPPVSEPAPTTATPAKEQAAQPTKSAKKSDAAKSGANATVRVDLDRVDRLINLVGELVINQAMLSQCVVEEGVARASSVESRLDELKQLTRELQESVMAIRAQPVKSLFQRMSRIVRECADATDKPARLVTDGEGTEVDKTVIERLADPLTHMIRNAVDHGLENPEKRAEAGKNPEGTVFLTAAHRSGRIVIEVSDDGGGINRERVRQIAVDKGLIPADAKLTDHEIDNLIFLPGFSTASEVSNLSGRGVGMDVVKRSIQALGGKASITSVPGKGSTFSISLPLTLAILDGMVVQVGDQTLVVPLTAVIETWKPSANDIEAIGPDTAVIKIRGEYIPLIDVGRTLGYRDEVADVTERVVIFVENNATTRSALLVDAIQDQRQVVIKSLEENYGAVPFVAAATILGDGRIALILDVDSVTALGGRPAGDDAPVALAS